MMDNLDDILQQRGVPKAPSNLAHRIVQAAKTSDKPKKSFGAAVLDYFRKFLALPRPVYASAFAVVFALFLGVGGVSQIYQSQTMVYDMEYDLVSYMLFDEEVW